MTPHEKYLAQKAGNHYCYGEYCNSCYKNMFEHRNVTESVAKDNFMTACPWCGKTWID